VFIAKNEKDILTDMRIAYSGLGLLQNRESRKILAGKHLPLGIKEVRLFCYDWKKYLTSHEALKKNNSGELISAQILNFIEDTISNFTD